MMLRMAKPQRLSSGHASDIRVRSPSGITESDSESPWHGHGPAGGGSDSDSGLPGGGPAAGTVTVTATVLRVLETPVRNSAIGLLALYHAAQTIPTAGRWARRPGPARSAAAAALAILGPRPSSKSGSMPNLLEFSPNFWLATAACVQVFLSSRYID
jgi:hypothetical protein